MNKFDRIRILKVLGLNTEVSVLISNAEQWLNHLEFLNQYSRYSVRTFRGAKYGRSDRHFPIVSREWLHGHYQELFEEGLSLIVADPIDPADAELAGGLLYNAGTISVEVALGPGTVRRITNEGLVDLSLNSERPGDTVGDARIDAAVSDVRKGAATLMERLRLQKIDGLLFEFSWYKIPVGWKKENLIFWELATSSRLEAKLERLVISSRSNDSL